MQTLWPAALLRTTIRQHDRGGSPLRQRTEHNPGPKREKWGAELPVDPMRRTPSGTTETKGRLTIVEIKISRSDCGNAEIDAKTGAKQRALRRRLVSKFVRVQLFSATVESRYTEQILDAHQKDQERTLVGLRSLPCAAHRESIPNSSSRNAL